MLGSRLTSHGILLQVEPLLLATLLWLTSIAGCTPISECLAPGCSNAGPGQIATSAATDGDAAAREQGRDAAQDLKRTPDAGARTQATQSAMSGTDGASAKNVPGGSPSGERQEGRSDARPDASVQDVARAGAAGEKAAASGSDMPEPANTVTATQMQPWPVAVASWAAGRVDVFVVGVDKQMHHKVLAGSSFWPSKTGWEAMGGEFITPGAATSWGEARVDVVAVGSDSQMFHKAWIGSSWYPSSTEWANLGGSFATAPAMNSWGENRFDIVAGGANQRMLHKAWLGASFWPSATGWDDLWGSFTGTPALASWAETRLDMLGVGDDGQMLHKAWTDSSWSPSERTWWELGGSFESSSTPAATSWGDGRLDVIAVGTMGQMLHKVWDQSAWMPSATEWESLGGSFASPGAIVTSGSNRLDLFSCGPDKQLYHKSWRDSTWLPSQTDWAASGGQFATPPSAVVSGPDRIDVFGVNDAGRVIHRVLMAGEWLAEWEEL